MSLIADLLSSPHKFAIVGVSQDTTKYGYELFEVLTKNGHVALPVNPKYQQIDHQPCYPALSELPDTPDAVISAISSSSAIHIAQSCVDLKIPVFWMPPGTESLEAIEFCQAHHLMELHEICPVFVLKLPKDRWQELP